MTTTSERTDVFAPMPIGANERGEVVTLRTELIIGSPAGGGKSVLARPIAVAVALDRTFSLTSPEDNSPSTPIELTPEIAL